MLQRRQRRQEGQRSHQQLQLTGVQLPTAPSGRMS
jgi:hypothetical protein